MILTGKRVNALEDRLIVEQKRKIDESLFRQASPRQMSGQGAFGAPYSYLAGTVRAFSRNRVGVFFFSLMLLLVAFAYLQPYLPNQRDPFVIYADASGMPLRSLAPCREFLFGTNSIGQDLFSRTWSAVRTSLLIAFCAAALETCAGVAGGLAWGSSARADAVVTEIYNIWHNIPQTLLLILISYVMKPGAATLVFSLAITGWLHTARFVRNQTVLIRDREYNLASRALGTPTRRILAKNILPYLVSVISLRASLAIPSAISHEVFISYIGLGLPSGQPSLGNLITTSIDKMLEPSLRYQLLIPAGILAAVSLSFYAAGSALADASDPKNHFA